ncbi:MAG TPA: L,D-transpeptidase family protein [Croceibacterium sp.]|jgi:murein L,D-transpeptidase YcbB/YkuD
MRLIADERLLRFVLPALAAALIAPLPQAAFADDTSVHDASGGGAAARIRADIADQAEGNDLRSFYGARANAPLWLDEFDRPSGAATLLWLRIRTADRDGLDPQQFHLDKLSKLLDRARDGGPDDAARAELALSAAYIAYAQAMIGAPHAQVLYENAALAPAVPRGFMLLQDAAKAPSLEDYIDRFGWMDPMYAPLRKALDDPQYSPTQRQVIAANLARIRAIPEIPQGKHILVDAASARLWMYEGDKIVDSMKVVVGSPELGTTPLMAGWIRWAIENPYWEVPDDITRNEIAPKVLAQGVKYLKGEHYQVLADWTEDSPVLDPSTVDWKAVRAGTLKVHVRQLPGGDNFMGKVKFEFPNGKGIYLHDTPAKNLMKEDARQLSHGCIRMENAAAMHQWLMGKPIPTDITQPEDKVPLPQPVPIYVTYLTAQPDGTGIAFHDDPYGLDAGVRLATAD